MPELSLVEAVYVVMGSTDPKRVLGWPVMAFDNPKHADQVAQFANMTARRNDQKIEGRAVFYFVYSSVVPVMTEKQYGSVPLDTIRRAMDFD